MKSPVVKRSVVVTGHKTSVSLEEEFWTSLKDIAQAHRLSLQDLVAKIDQSREYANLSSAIRVFVLAHFKSRAKEVGSKPTEAEQLSINVSR